MAVTFFGDNMNPYSDTDREEDGESWIRIFDHSVINSELVWHRDINSRKIEVLEGTGWQLQMDNELPIELVAGETYTIPSMSFHRILKGEDYLIIKITETQCS